MLGGDVIFYVTLQTELKVVCIGGATYHRGDSMPPIARPSVHAAWQPHGGVRHRRMGTCFHVAAAVVDTLRLVSSELHQKRFWTAGHTSALLTNF